MHQGLQKYKHTHLCLSALWLLTQLVLFQSITFASPCPELRSFQKILQSRAIYFEHYPFAKTAIRPRHQRSFIFKFIQLNDAAFQRSPSFVLSQAFSLACAPNCTPRKLHYSSPSYAYAHSSAEGWADILSALQMAWPLDAAHNYAGDRAGETPSKPIVVQRGRGKDPELLGIQGM